MVAIGALIQNDKNEILLVRRSKKLDWQPNEWEIPYGRLSQHEDAQTALRRELMEEVGLSVLEPKPLTAWHIYRGDEKNAHNELIGITFVCKLKSGEVKLSDEHEEFVWISPSEAIKLINVRGIQKDIEALISITENKQS